MPATKKWLQKFSSTKKVKLLPYNPRAPIVATELMHELGKLLGPGAEIEHRGASALGIAGKGEIDLYIRVPLSKFKPFLNKLMRRYGKPDSLEKGRARFNKRHKGFEFEIMLINKNSSDEKEGRAFFNYLKAHPAAAKQYERIKKKYARVSKRAYYSQKDKFISKILKRSKCNES